MKRWQCPVLLVFGICSVVPLFAKGRKPLVEKQSVEVKTAYGKFVFSELQIERNNIDEWVLAGSAANETDRSWRYVKFGVQLLGEDGRPVHDGTFTMDQFRKGQTSPIKDVTGSSQGATLGFAERKTRVSDFSITFLQSDSVFDFKYVISMIKPQPSDDLSYEDSDVVIRFTPGDLKLIGSQLHFSLENKTDSPITVPWDKISYVDWSRGSHRVIHEGVRLIDRDKPQAVSTVAPTARLDDLIYPADYVDADVPFLPLREPNTVVGATFSVFMPLEIKGHEKNFLFTFRVERVELK